MRDLARLRLPGLGADRAEGTQRPAIAALPGIGVAAVVLAGGLAAAVPWPEVASIAGALVVAGLLRAAWAAAELGRSRRLADDWLLWGATARPASALLSRRARELTSSRLRATLARSLRGLESEVRGRVVPGPIPLNRRAIRANLQLVDTLRARLEDRERPVSVRGMLLGDRLLTEPGSPLYSYVADEVLAEALSDVLAALDPVPLATVA